MKLIVAAAAALCLTATGAEAAIQVLNASFEENPLADGDFKFGINNWSTVRNAGVANPTANLFTAVPHGQNTAFIGTGIDESGAYGGRMSQTQAVSLAADTRYTFSVDVGRRSDGIDLADFQVSLLVGGDVVALGSLTNADIAPGEFKTLTLSFDNLTDVFGFEIRFESFWNAAQGSAYRQVNFDNVRFDAVSLTPGGAVPEPATWAMMILGFGVVGATLRTRRNGLALV
jgi:hypothetical protein